MSVFDRISTHLASTLSTTSGDGYPEAVDAIVAEIAVNRSAVVELAEALGPTLASEDEEQRQHGTTVFAEVLRKCHVVEFDTAETSVLVAFLSARLADSSSVQAAVDGLLGLLNGQPSAAGAESTIAAAVIRSVKAQTYPQRTRASIFVLLHALVVRAGPELSAALGEEFARNVVVQVDGERDPRCLIVVLRLVALSHLPAALASLAHDTSARTASGKRTTVAIVTSPALSFEQVGKVADDLFDVTSCYFPITFNPPPGDTIGITRANLVDALLDCLVATIEFAPACMELIFEKLGTPLDETKMQCYMLLVKAAKAFRADGLGPYLSRVYVSVRTEMFQSFDEDIKQAALVTLLFTLAQAPRRAVSAKPAALLLPSCLRSRPISAGALTAVTAALSTSVVSSGAQSDLSIFLGPIVGEGTRCLGDYDVGLIRLHARVVAAAAGGSDAAATELLSAYGTVVLERLEHEEQPDHAHREAFIESLALLVRATPAPDSAAAPHAERLLLVAAHSASASSAPPEVRRAGLLCAAALVRTAVVDRSGMDNLAAVATARLLDDPDHGVRQDGRILAVAITSFQPAATTAVVLPALAEALVGARPRLEASAEEVANALVDIAAIDASIATTVASELVEAVETCPQIAAAALERVLVGAIAEGPEAAERFLATVVRPIVERVVAAAAAGSSDGVGVSSHLLEPAVLMRLAAAVGSAVAAMTTAAQAALFAETATAFSSGDTPTFPGSSLEVLSAILCGLRREVVAEAVGTAATSAAGSEPAPKKQRESSPAAAVDLPALLAALLARALAASPHGDSAAAAAAVAALLNKCAGPEVAAVGVPTAMVDLAAPLLTAVQAALPRAEATMTWAWLTKAFSTAGHRSTAMMASVMTENLGGGVEDGAQAEAAAEGFRIVMEDAPLAVSSKTHGVVRLLHKQRFFVLTMPALVEACRDAAHCEGGSTAGADHSQYLAALAHLLSNIPKQALLGELPVVLPLLFKSLGDTASPRVAASSLSVVHMLLSDAQNELLPHAASLVTLMLELGKGSKAMAVRSGALKCLLAVAELPGQLKLPILS